MRIAEYGMECKKKEESQSRRTGMQVTKNIHALKIPFQVPIGPGRAVERFVFVYLIYGERICLIDTGVASSEKVIFEYLAKTGRRQEEVFLLLLTHSHPDHIGAARAIHDATGCVIAAHGAEQNWIEDVGLQATERPVPGFNSLVAGSVNVDRILNDGESLSLGPRLTLAVIHTPGHSRGSLSFFLREEGSLISGDAIPIAGQMPIYDDAAASISSIKKLERINGVKALLSSWDEPRMAGSAIEAMEGGVRYLRRIHEAAIKAAGDDPAPDATAVCRVALRDLGLPPAMANPLVARSVEAHLKIRGSLAMTADRNTASGKEKNPMDEQKMKAMLIDTFNTVSDSYDSRELRFFRESAKNMAGLLQLRGDEHLLDVACGTGNAALAIAPRLPRGRVTAVDFSSGMLDQARRKAGLLKLANVEFLERDMQNPGFREGTFDAAVCAFGIFFVTDMDAQLERIASLVRPGGSIMITNFREDYFSPMKELFFDRIASYGVPIPPQQWRSIAHEAGCRRLFEAAGLTDVRVETRNAGYYLESAEEWWSIVWNAGLRRMVTQLSPDNLERFRREHLREVEAQRTGKGIWLDVGVLYTVGRK
jgi:hydroxyacylglutathione hydrolase